MLKDKREEVGDEARYQPLVFEKHTIQWFFNLRGMVLWKGPWKGEIVSWCLY